MQANNNNSIQSYTIKIEGPVKANRAGAPMIDCWIEGITNKYPYKGLNLTPEQGARIVPGVEEYTCSLAQGSLKKDNTGQPRDPRYLNNYYWDVALFDGIESERVMQQARSGGAQNVAVQPSQAPPAPYTPPAVAQNPVAPTASTGYWTDNLDDRGKSIIRQVAFKEAAAKGGTLKEIARRTDDYELIILGKLNFVEEDVYARDKTDIADSTGSDEDSQGVVSYSRSSNEDVYTYPAPKDPITFDEFSIYVLNAGWTWDNVCKWLDGEPLEWVKGGLGRNLYKALRVCTEGADNSGIIPPENFREKVN